MQYQYHQQQQPPPPAGAPMPTTQQQQQQQPPAYYGQGQQPPPQPQQQQQPQPQPPQPQEAANPFDQFDQPPAQQMQQQQPPQPQQPPMQMQMQYQQPPPSSSSLVPAQQQQNATQWGLPQQQQQQQPPMPQQQPFGMPAPAVPPQQAPQTTNFDPFGSAPAPAAAPAAMPVVAAAAAPVQTYQQASHDLVASPPPAAAPPAAPSDDPFGVFAAAPAPVQPQQPQPPVPADADPFGLGTSYQRSSSNGLNESFASSLSNSGHGNGDGGMGLFAAGTDPTIGAAASSWLDVSDLTNAAAGNAEGAAYVAHSSSPPGALPPGGEHYQVDIPDRLLGLVMYKPTAAASCGILAHHGPVTVQSLGPSRPVVTHLNTNSAARAAGVALGDVVTAINGREVADRVDASNLIRSAPRPVTLQMYRLPGPPPALYQGDVWVHYKNRDPLPPPKVKDWKAKFVVVGGILGGGNGSKVINMYRSRAEYDRAVADVHSGRRVSVKVKQFSLEGGARLWFKDGTTDGGMSGGDGMETIKYPAEDASRQYVNILMPKPANNVKLSVPAGQTNQLRSVLDGIRLALYMYSN